MLRGSLEDMKSYEMEMKNQIQNKIKNDINKRKEEVAEMTSLRNLIGKPIKFVYNFFDDRKDENIILSGNGTFYLSNDLIPDPLYQEAEDASYSDFSVGESSRPYKSIYLVVDKETIKKSERKFRLVYEERCKAKCCQELTKNNIEYRVEDISIILLSNIEKGNLIIDKVIKEFLEEEDRIQEQSDLILERENDFLEYDIDGDTEI